MASVVKARHRGEKCRDPDDPRRDPAQQFRLGPDPKREQHHREHEKPYREPDLAALAPRQPEIAAHEPQKPRHRQAAPAAGV